MITKWLNGVLGLWFRPVSEALVTIERAVRRLEDAIPRKSEQLEFQIVIWGISVSNESDGSDPSARDPSTRESCFSLSGVAVAGMLQRMSFQPQCLFKMKRWLLLGPDQLRVRDVMVGQNIQAPVFAALQGIAGRYGEGSFDAASVGNVVSFEVS